MRRGDIVTVALSGDYGKPRPAVVIQVDRLADMDSVLVCQITTTFRDAPFYRLTVPLAPGTGLRELSHVMADKIAAAKRSKCGPAIGRLPRNLMRALDRMLAVIIGLAD
jgi:mRNA interferase MazF